MPEDIGSGTAEKRKQLISNELKFRIVEGKYPESCYAELSRIVKQSLGFVGYNKKAYDLTMTGLTFPELVTSVTNALFLDIADRKFSNKRINLETYCTSLVYRMIAENLGMNKDTMWLIRRVRNICTTYGVSVSPSEAYKAYRLAALTDYKKPITLSQAINALAWLSENEKTRVRKKNATNSLDYSYSDDMDDAMSF